MTDRDKFEAWYCKNYSKAISHMERHENSGDYCCRQTRASWRAWQAALASQQPADDGWIEWRGGDCPVDESTVVQVKGSLKGTYSGQARDFAWHHKDKALKSDWDIIAYRVVKS